MLGYTPQIVHSEREQQQTWTDEIEDQPDYLYTIRSALRDETRLAATINMAQHHTRLDERAKRTREASTGGDLVLVRD